MTSSPPTSRSAGDNSMRTLPFVIVVLTSSAVVLIVTGEPAIADSIEAPARVCASTTALANSVSASPVGHKRRRGEAALFDNSYLTNLFILINGLIASSAVPPAQPSRPTAATIRLKPKQ